MYITISDLELQGITGENAYLQALVDRSEAIFNTLIGNEEGILTQTRTQEFENVCNVNSIWLEYSNPTSLTSVNGSSVASGDYKFIGQNLKLKNAVNSLSDFPYLLTIVYVAGYEETPDDVKQVCLSLAGYLHNAKNSQGISSFSQDLLQVSYGAKEAYDYIEKTGQSSIINKYKTFYAYSL